MALLDGVLLWFHIFSAIGWLGSTMLFGMLLGPMLPKFSPQTRAEIVVKFFPKFSIYVEIFGILTLIFGVLATFALIRGDFSLLAPTTQFGLFISVGALLALVAMLDGIFVIGPATLKIARLTEEMMKNPGPPSPELVKASNKVRTSASAGLVILILVLVCMVAAVS